MLYKLYYLFMVYLIVGLGNLGLKYVKNRHNAGFLALDFILNSINPQHSFKNEHKALVAREAIQNKKVIFAKPQTFMNLSGTSVFSLIKFYKISTLNLIVIHDDIDLHFGRVKLKFSGGNAGHNGLKDIDKKIGNDYHRIRIGVGRPINNQSVADYVLNNFTEEEQKTLNNEIFNNVFNFVKEIINEQK